MVGFSSEKWFSESSFYPHEIGQSARFDKANSAYLSRAPSSPGNKTTFTWSGWVKFCSSASYRLFSSGTSASEITDFHMNGSDGTLRFRDKHDGDNLRKETTAVLRDVGAWYHLVCAVDVTQGSNSNRVKIYINGTLQTAFDTDDTFVNRNTYINRTGGNGMVLGKRAYDSASLLDGYMAEVHFVDGTQLTADSFGETKEGVWIPKAYTGSYGTNGFYLKFDQTGTGTASASTIGADSSGNNNHFTTSAFASTDSNIPDSPTNNFCTMNPLALSNTGSADFEMGNTKITLADNEEAFGTFGVSSGKWYWEVDHHSSASSNNKLGIGIADADAPNNNEQVNYGHQATTWGVGDIIGVAVNVDDEEITFYKNNTAIETNTDWSSKGWTTIVPILTSANSAGNEVAHINFGQDSSFNNNVTKQSNSDENNRGDFYYSPPSGYLALCSANLPEPTISPLNGDQPADHFNTVLYTGNGATQSITGVGFQPDWVWIKERNSAVDHKLYDSVRGATELIISNDTDAEVTHSTGLTSFDNDGFSIGSAASVNGSSDTYVAWNWLGANGTATNSDGDLTSTVSANTTAGFSIVSYNSGSSASSNQTVGHGLGVVPKMIIAKSRFASGAWNVYHADVGNDKRLRLDTDAAEATSAVWGDTTPTSSVFTQRITTTNNKDIIAYCFSNVEGYSKFGSYTGNGDADGTFVYTGFRPAWLMWKRTNSTNQWTMHDATRNPNNPTDQVMYANLTQADGTADAIVTDLVSNGFKLRSGSSGNANTSGSSYIYMAFAEMPFKYANAR